MRLIGARSRAVVLLACGAILALGAVLVALSLAKSAGADPATVTCSPGTDVQTNSGPVCGLVTGGVQEWLGIPYAAPPVGDLRWQPPQPPPPWTATRQATAFGSQCAQYFPLFSPNVTGSEDCLYVNVWRPNDASSGLPVMVHIHGGGFVIGSG